MLLYDANYYICLIFLLLVLFLLESRLAQIILLIVTSYFLYILSNSYLILSVAFITILTFYCGKFIHNHTNKTFYLASALLGALGQLALFKYTGVLGALGFSFSALGVSYYTFMALSYVFDIYRGKMKPTDSLLEYAFFVSFFPLMTSGPIIRAKEFLNQLKTRIVITPENLQQGVTLIAVGLIMKLVIADNLAIYVDTIFSDPMKYGSREIILATLAFGLQLYFDFAGYSDMALGSARIMGFKFSMNFNNPYLALNPQDFWHRWNISLSCYLRDYIYIPLGGNRKGKFRTYLNLMVTMVVCGLWHGATLNFLIWGGYHGILLTIHRSTHILNKTKGVHTVALLHGVQNHKRAYSFVGILLTQYFVFLGWIIFKVNNLDDLIYCLHQFIVPTGFGYRSFIIGVTVVSILLLFRNKIANNNWIDYLGAMRPLYWFIFLCISINIIYWFSPVRVTKFIYAGF